MASKEFFTELENFMPQYVSPLKSYVHAFIVFIVIIAVGHSLSDKLSMTIDIDGDGSENDFERRSRIAIYYCGLVIVGLVSSDFIYSLSWRLRNKVNRKFLTYSRWFPKFFS